MKTRLAFFIFILSVLLNRSIAQSNPCGLVVDAGPDITICAGTGKNLKGKSNAFEIRWDPPDGLSNRYSLTTLASPSITTIYTLTGKGRSSVNLITNGNFETGSISPATSDYTSYSDLNSWITSTGGYMVLNASQVNNAFDCNGTWPHLGGYILAITPTGSGTSIWCITLPLKPYTDYKIYFDVFGTAYTGPLPEVGLTVNGILIKSVKVRPCAGTWDTNVTWNSGPATSGDFCFINLGVTGPENMYGLDNIGIWETCEAKDSITVNVVPALNAIAVPPNEINCANKTITIDASASSQGAGITTEWSTINGHIVSGEKTLMPIVDTPGTYTLKIKGPYCEKELTVVVKGSLIKPDLKIKSVDFDCQNNNASIEAISNTKSLQYEWIGPNAFFSTKAKNDNLIDTGEYIIKVIDSYYCESALRVEIKDNRNILNAEISGDSIITCIKDSAVLIANSIANKAVYRWTGPLTFKKDSLKKINVRDNGWYYLTTIDSAGCKELDSFYVNDLRTPIPITIQADTIKCNVSEVILQLQTDTTATIKWKGPGGFQSILFQPKVFESGWYYVEIETRDNCKRIDSIFVAKALDIPDIFISGNDTITCDKKIIEISGGSNSPGTVIEWITPTGSIKNQNTIQTIDTGNYTLIVKDVNGCQISKSVQIVKDVIAPSVIGYNDTLTCLKTLASLISNSSDPLANISWSGPNGFQSNQDSTQTDQSGTYFIIGISRNGCSDTAQVIIATDTLHPLLSTSDDTINCIKTVLNLSLIDLYNSTYSWTGPNNFTSTQKNPIINSPGIYEVTASLPNGCSSIQQITISSDLAKPIIQVNNDTLTCKKDSTILNASNDQSNALVEWTGPNGFTSNQINPFVITPGNYQLLVTNPNGCKDSTSLIIFQDIGKPDLTANADTLNCGTRTADLFASSSKDSLTYLWTGPNGFTASTKTISVNQGGTYTIRISTPEDCFSVLNVDVFEDTIRPDLKLFPDTLNCLKTQTNLLFNSNSQLISQDWNGPANFNSTQKNPLITQGGNYTLKVTATNQCIELKTISIVQDTIRPIIAAIPDSINCNKREVDLIANVIPVNLIGEWTLPNQQKIKTNAIKTKAGGDFIFDVVGENYCVNSISLNVPVDTLIPDLLVIDDTINCKLSKAYLNAISNTKGLTYEWTGPNSYSSSVASDSVKEAGIYHVKITALNGCIQMGDVIISIDTIKPLVYITGDTFIDCTHPTITLIPGSNLINGTPFIWYRLDTFKWIGSSIPNITISTAGLYHVQTTNPVNRCIGEVNIKVIKDSLIISDVSIDQVNPVCGAINGSAQIVKVIGGHNNIQYSIDQKRTFTSNPNFNPLPIGLYTLYVKDEKDCEFQKDFEIVELPFIETNIVPEITLILGDSTRMDLDIIPDRNLVKSIHWNPSTFLSCTDCEDPLAKPLVTTDYDVTVIDTNGCQSIQRIRVVVETPKVWVPNVFSPNGDNINDQVWIFGSKAEVTRINIFQIFDRWGNRVFENTNFQPNDSSKGWNGNYQDQKCNPGVYVYWAEVELTDGQKWIIKGDITLIR